MSIMFIKPKVLKLLLAIPVLFGVNQASFAATCSCAGVPLLASINTSATEQGDLFLSSSTENHLINDLVSGSSDVTDETDRQRDSLSQVLSASYAISDRWSVSGLVSYVEHNREIGSSIFGKTTSSGVGDSVLLLRYLPIFITPFSRHEVSLGLGARIPTGEDDFDFGNGFNSSEDMQPSVGAWGTIAWASYSYAFNQASTVLLNLSTNHISNDENKRHYQFGNEFNFDIGVSQSIGTKFGYSATLRYRTTDADRRSGTLIPNTGGEWR